MDRLAELNPSQRDAVRTLSGPLLVLAGAGTGKTRVITHRIAELIRNGTQPERILSVTFTNKAAREMLERTRQLLGRSKQGKPQISTFHSLCVRILRQDATALGYPLNFAIYDRSDQESAARVALREIRINEKSMRPGDLLARISRWKSAGVAPGDATEFVDSDFDFLAATAYRRYQANLRSCGAVDFDDLLLLTNQLFAGFPDVLARHQKRFDHVQIDEYQDTNALQFRLVQALVKPHRSLCVVGDDDQSIYGWRGAEVEHILNFQAQFPGAKVVRLEDNYRCTDAILDAANRLVRNNRGRHEKTLIAHKRASSEVRFAEFPDEVLEAEHIVREISLLVNQHQVSPADVAILFRTNEQPRVFESEMRRARLPYRLVGGQSFFERREVRDVLAYLKTLAHPDDEVSLRRIINVPARGIGTASLEKLVARAVRDGCPFWEAIPAAAAAGDLAPKTVGALNAFHDLLKSYRRQFDDSPTKLADTLKSLLEQIDYRSEIQKQYKDPQQELARTAALEQMVDAVAQYTERTKQPTLAGFLEETALLGREEEFDNEEPLDQRAVTLMTLHSAKGLEFPRVYLVGLEEGLLPHHRSLEGGESAIAEERRLAYVGITRAMDHLAISRAAARMKWGKRRASIPSRFLFEMRNGEALPVSDESAED